VTQKLERIRTLYLEGDLDDAEYRRQRAEANEALTSIPPDELPASEAVGRRLAALLADLSMAWTVATPDERNQIARQLFADVVVDNRTAVAVKPRPELAPFFESLAVNPDPEITLKRKRRGSLPRRRDLDGYVVIAEAPDVPRVGRSGRAATVERRVMIDQQARARVVVLAEAGLSLRAIAREVGISHEAVRTVLRAEVATVA
jgi:hypothetical protein